MHGGVAGVGGQPPPLCRSSRRYVKLRPAFAAASRATGLSLAKIEIVMTLEELQREYTPLRQQADAVRSYL